MNALLERFRRPTLALGFLVVYLPYVIQGYRNTRDSGALGHPEGWLSLLAVPALVISGYLWFSPLPWQWGGKRLVSPGLVRGGMQALLFSEAWILSLVLLKHGLDIRSGDPGPLGNGLIFNGTFWAPIMVLVGGLQARREAEEHDRVQAQAHAQQAQTRLLQSQLHPHVLFNAINGIAELTAMDPEKAERCLLALGDLLRKLLKASRRELMPLSEERELAEDYLLLESTRLGDRLGVEWRWDPALDVRETIPLLIQPLVENAIKHGVAPNPDGGRIRIEGGVSETGIRLAVSNTGMGLVPGQSEGVGLWNLHSRLELAYSGKASFRLEQRGSWTLAEIQLPT